MRWRGCQSGGSDAQPPFEVTLDVPIHSKTLVSPTTQRMTLVTSDADGTTDGSGISSDEDYEAQVSGFAALRRFREALGKYWW